MEKDKSVNLVGGSLPPTGRYMTFPPPVNVKSEPSGSIALPPLGPGSTSEAGRFGHGRSSDSSGFSHDISQMPDNPPKKLGHRRAHSEIVTLPDDISFDSDLGVVGGLDGPSFSDDTEEDLFSMYLDMDKFNSSSATSMMQMERQSSALGPSSSEGQAQASTQAAVQGADTPSPEHAARMSNERPRIRHQHSQSMDGSTTIKPEMLMSGGDDTPSIEAKKSMSAANLAELALVDPKRAKRIWANRQSAARSKERKMRYIAELERKVQTLQTEATSLSAQLTLLQRDTNGLTAENSELKLRLQTTEQQVHLQDALNDALKEEIQHLKLLTGQNIGIGGPMLNFPPSYRANQQVFPNQGMNTMLTAQQLQQLQQLQIQAQKQQQQFQQQQQLQQFRQQQIHQHQTPQPKQQEQHFSPNVDFKMKGPMTSASVRESSPDFNQHPSKD